MAPQKSRAFIIQSCDYRETSKLLHVLCRDEGRITLVAKGLRSPKSKKASAAEAFNLVQITYGIRDGATMGTLNSIDLERTYSGLRTSLEAYGIASYWFEILQVAGQARLEPQELFTLTEEFLALIGNGIGGVSPAVLKKFCELLQSLGFGVRFSVCGMCGGTDLIDHFDPAAGASVCARCVRPFKNYLPLPEAMKGSSCGKRTRPHAVADICVFFEILNQLLTLHLEHRFKTYGFLCDVLSGKTIT